MLVRGRVDHKEAGKVCVIVQDVERFDPSDAEIEKAKEQVARLAAGPRPAALRARRRRPPAATVIDELRDLFERYPGEAEFVLEMHTRTGLRALRFGDGSRSPADGASEGRARPRARAGAGARYRGCVTRVAVVGPGAIGAAAAAAVGAARRRRARAVRAHAARAAGRRR